MATRVLRKRLKSVLQVAGLGAEAISMGTRSLIEAARSESRPPARAPYMQSVSASSAVVAWVSEEPSVGSVEYGETMGFGRREIDERASRRHAVELSDLRPGTAYYYRVMEGNRLPAIGHFRTAPEGNDSSFTFAVIGDSGNGRKNQLAVAGLLERLTPDLILHTGDVVYPSGEDRHYDRRFFVPYRRLLEEVPIFPTLGNHDVEKGDGVAYLKNFHLPRNNPQNTERYYSFDWGNAHFVALDSELYHEDGSGSPAEQKAWLERDLAMTRLPWKIVFFHRPIYSSSNHGSDEKIREDLESILVHRRVNMVFNGHDHNYERTVPIGGVTYIVAGGGGKRLYRAGRNNWTAFSRSTYHVVLVSIDGDHLSLKAIEPDGTVIDSLNLDHP